MSRPLHFIWGPGGVGKTHFAIRFAHRSGHGSRLLTLDPSYRLFDLLDLERKSGEQVKKFDDTEIYVRQTDALRLFDRLDSLRPAKPEVKVYFHELVNGLHRFRDYLCLLDLAEEIQQPTQLPLIVDTPPLTEARALTKSITDLHSFFRSPLFQMTMGSSILRSGMNKALDFAKSFLGKVGVERAMEFVQWLSEHIDAFHKNTDILESLMYRKETKHSLILTPDISLKQLEEASIFFQKVSDVEIIINRSLKHLPRAPQSFPALRQELDDKNRLESDLLKVVADLFPKAEIKYFPLVLMGDDTDQELVEFLKINFIS